MTSSRRDELGLDRATVVDVFERGDDDDDDAWRKNAFGDHGTGGRSPDVPSRG